MQLGEPYSSASDWPVKPERPGRKDSYRDGNSAGDRRLRSSRRRRDRLGGRRDIHDSFPKGIRNSPCDAYLLADQGDTVANADRHAPLNTHSFEKREADARQADAREAKADEAGAREAEACEASADKAEADEAEAETRHASARQAEAEADEAEAETRHAEVREAEAEADTCEAEAQGSTGTRPGVVEPPGSHADRDANGGAETEPHGDSDAHAHGNANSGAKRGSDA